jgi:hypothetical protein
VGDEDGIVGFSQATASDLLIKVRAQEKLEAQNGAAGLVIDGAIRDSGAIVIIVIPEAFSDPEIASVRLAEVANVWTARPDLVKSRRSIGFDRARVGSMPEGARGRKVRSCAS